MGRIYAGILGPLAMAVIICRGIKDSAGVEGTLTMAIVALAAYADRRRRCSGRSPKRRSTNRSAGRSNSNWPPTPRHAEQRRDRTSQRPSPR